MKKIFKLGVAFLSLSALVGGAYATTPGSYVGAGLGESNVQKQSHASNHNNGIAGRLFAGYNFNEYFGLEAGLAKYAQAKSNYHFKVNNITNPAVFNNFFGSAKTDLTTVDLVGKAYLPISDSGFNLYGLAGLAYVHQAGNYHTTSANAAGATMSSKFNNTGNSIHPIYGLGAGYNIPQSNITTNLEYTRLQGSTKIFGGKTAANANMVTFNVAYNFD